MTVLAAAIYATYLDMSRNGIQQQPELNTLEKQLEEACKDLNDVEDPMAKTTALLPSEKGFYRSYSFNEGHDLNIILKYYFRGT